jgi:DNA invertase Pin-like site-specific DNA recombinase
VSVARDSLGQPLYGLAYCRISGSREQRDSALSIAAQRSHVLLAMDREGAVPFDSDADILSGKRADRRGYQRILAVTRRLRSEGKQVAIFVMRLDRFGRELEERARAWDELVALGARLYSLKDGGWVEDASTYHLNAVISQREIELNSMRVKETHEFVRRNGFPIIGRLAWGYRSRPATAEERAQGSGRTTLEPHPIEATVVREAFDMRARGASLHALQDWAIALSEAERGGRMMDWQLFDRLFRAPVYVARYDYPEGHSNHPLPILDRPRGKWEPIVSDELWLACQEQIKRAQRRPRRASEQHLLTGMIRCPRCGTRMGGTSQRGVTATRSACIKSIAASSRCSGSHRGGRATRGATTPRLPSRSTPSCSTSYGRCSRPITSHGWWRACRWPGSGVARWATATTRRT